MLISNKYYIISGEGKELFEKNSFSNAFHRTPNLFSKAFIQITVCCYLFLNSIYLFIKHSREKIPVFLFFFTQTGTVEFRLCLAFIYLGKSYFLSKKTHDFPTKKPKNRNSIVPVFSYSFVVEYIPSTVIIH